MQIFTINQEVFLLAFSAYTLQIVFIPVPFPYRSFLTKLRLPVVHLRMIVGRTQNLHRCAGLRVECRHIKMILQNFTAKMEFICPKSTMCLTCSKLLCSLNDVTRLSPQDS